MDNYALLCSLIFLSIPVSRKLKRIFAVSYGLPSLRAIIKSVFLSTKYIVIQVAIGLDEFSKHLIIA